MYVHGLLLGHLVVNKASGFNAVVTSSVKNKINNCKYYSTMLLYKGEMYIYFHTMG